MYYHFPKEKFCFGVNYRGILLHHCQVHARLTYKFNPINSSVEWICRISQRRKAGTTQPSRCDSLLKAAVHAPSLGRRSAHSKRKGTYPPQTYHSDPEWFRVTTGRSSGLAKKTKKAPTQVENMLSFRVIYSDSEMDLNLEEMMWEQETVKTENTFHLCTASQRFLLLLELQP